ELTAPPPLTEQRDVALMQIAHGGDEGDALAGGAGGGGARLHGAWRGDDLEAHQPFFPPGSGKRGMHDRPAAGSISATPPPAAASFFSGRARSFSRLKLCSGPGNSPLRTSLMKVSTAVRTRTARLS